MQTLRYHSWPRRSIFQLVSTLGLSAVCLLTSGQALAVTPSQPVIVVNNEFMTGSETFGNNSARAFYEALDESLSARGTNLAAICDENDPMARRVLQDYGAVFIVREEVTAPPVCVFEGESAVSRFQQEAGSSTANLGTGVIELQTAAMEALLAAREAAQAQGLNITPRGAGDAARRSFATTLRLWDSRFTPALAHWTKAGRIASADAAQMRRSAWREQVWQVLEWEKDGIFFSTDFSKSILYSVAAPGTSQHLSMLALDVKEFANPQVRAILADYGWFQTVQSDAPHFTYLGWPESELPAHGLRRVRNNGQIFWIPNI